MHRAAHYAPPGQRTRLAECAAPPGHRRLRGGRPNLIARRRSTRDRLGRHRARGLPGQERGSRPKAPPLSSCRLSQPRSVRLLVGDPRPLYSMVRHQTRSHRRHSRARNRSRTTTPLHCARGHGASPPDPRTRRHCSLPSRVGTACHRLRELPAVRCEQQVLRPTLRGCRREGVLPSGLRTRWRSTCPSRIEMAGGAVCGRPGITSIPRGKRDEIICFIARAMIRDFLAGWLTRRLPEYLGPVHLLAALSWKAGSIRR